MPEGPEVRITCDILNNDIQGYLLTSIEWNQNSQFHKSGIPGFETLTFPYQIDEVWCVGKQIFFTLVPPDTQFQNLESVRILNSHLGMEGHWVYSPENHSNTWMNLRSPDGQDLILYFNDTRRFGKLAVYSQKNLQARMDKIGPDLLSENVTLEMWLEKARSRYVQKMEIVKWLMEQKYFSGIGNYLKAEILYRAQIAPTRKISDLSVEDLSTLYTCAINILRESYQSQGLTRRAGTFWNPRSQKGSFADKLQVYEKSEDLEGREVVRETFSDGRTTHWVPSVQK